MKTFTDWLRRHATEWAKRVFVIDPRSLRAFRVALGALVLMDLGVRARALSDHYSDSGVLPRRALFEDPSATFHFCLHAWAGPSWFEGLLFAVAAVLAAAFAVGRGGPAVTAALWLLTVSLQNRNVMVLNKGDQILRLMLFWSMFLPLKSREPVRSAGSAGLLIQAAIVWLVSASLKTSRDWFPDGTATYYALQVDQAATAFGRWIGGIFVLTKALTYGVFFMEWAAAFLLFSPVRTDALRVVGIVALVAMHLGFALSLRLGFFPAISVCSLLPFVPASVWRAFGAQQVVAAPRRPGRWGSAVPLGALLLVLWINATAVLSPRMVQPAALKHLIDVLRLDQSWAMFAPRPWRETNWVVATGRLADGRIVDAYHPSLEPPSRSEPERLSSTFPSPRWLYYMTNLVAPENARERPWFAVYLCRRFDAAHLTQLPVREIEVDVYRRWALADYRRTPPREEVLWRQICEAPAVGSVQVPVRSPIVSD